MKIFGGSGRGLRCYGNELATLKGLLSTDIVPPYQVYAKRNFVTTPFGILHFHGFIDLKCGRCGRIPDACRCDFITAEEVKS
jgi:hypothetical protein